MDDVIKCQVCGEDNPADLEFCQNCQSRLRPLTGPLRDENEPIQPGDVPTKKVTAELEPILPQWLREARQQARQSEQEEPGQAVDEPETTPRSQGPDLLAGLASQSDDEDEETPDWLANITGVPAKKKKTEPDETQVKWVELGHDEPSDATNETEESNPLPWLNSQESTPEKDELSEWFNQASASTSQEAGAASASSPAFVSKPSPEDGGDQNVEWFKNLEADVPTFNQEETGQSEMPPAREEAPDWLKNLEAEAANPVPDSRQDISPDRASEEGTADAETPDWLKNLDAGASNPASDSPQGVPPDRASGEATAGAETPDWLKNLDAGASSSPFLTTSDLESPAEPAPAENAETPDWLMDLGTSAPVSQPTNTEESSPVEGALGEGLSPEEQSGLGESMVPDWLNAFGEESTSAETPESPSDTQVSDWSGSAASSAHEPQTPPEESPESMPEEATGAGELPDWMASLGTVESQPTESSMPAFASGESPAGTPSASPFEEETPPEGDVDAIFSSMQLPDWLSDSAPSDSSTDQGSLPPAAQSEESIAPVELPSWVQAMRPVESAMPTPPEEPMDTTPESGGPLAGLHGVLPAIPGVIEPSKKPTTHSLKLDATEEQQAHSALLEKILAAETSPLPIKAVSMLASQRILRWGITALLFLVLGGVVFGGTQIFPLPSAVPNETIRAVQSIDAIPEGAPVLAVFDYEPSTVGEMEATGASLLDHLLLLRHPRLALISTSPTGAALAERFMSKSLAERTRDYQRGVQYVDLGYLPGGLTGVYDFAQSPTTTVVAGADSSAVWASPVLQKVTNLSDFAAVIVLTDSAEAGRTWIEQTQLFRGNTMMIMVSSAQAGPMLIPYADSGQLNGLVAGINGAAGTEQVNGNLPGFVRRYWDAYSLGLLMAVILILLGGVWSLWRGLQDQRKREAA